MAGKGGGGAWKVAYADFVTAMMAFFMVMWIAGQDQKIRRSVSEYFSDPLGASDTGISKRASRTGATTDNLQAGSIPLEEKVALGQGRKSHTQERTKSPATKRVSDWIHLDKDVSKYWQKQAHDQREAAQWSKEVRDKSSSMEEIATRQLVKQLQEELHREIPGKSTGIHRELLLEALRDVNWTEVAEDLIGR